VTPLFKKNVAPTESGETPPTTQGADGMHDPAATKGRPTPKRRTTSKPAPPAPRTRKEAAAWQRQQGAKSKVAGQRKLTGEEYRAAMKAGDPRVLPRRDQGELRAFARDYADSHRMLSNYLLALIPIYLVTTIALPKLSLLPFLLFLVLFAEWIVTGRRILKMAAERNITHKEGAVTIGVYAGMRAYLKRSWRRPAPRVDLGQKI
jgi:hypothetical protein